MTGYLIPAGVALLVIAHLFIGWPVAKGIPLIKLISIETDAHLLCPGVTVDKVNRTASVFRADVCHFLCAVGIDGHLFKHAGPRVVLHSDSGLRSVHKIDRHVRREVFLARQRQQTEDQ